MSPCVSIVNPKLLIIFSSHHDALEITSLINISTRNAVCVINGRHLSYIALSRSFHTAWSQVQISILSTTGVGTESESVPESVSRSVNEP